MGQAGAEVKMPAGPASGRLLRVLGVGFGLAVTIGGTIGMGILRTPGDVAAQLPNPWLLIGVWIAGGLYSLLGATSVAELGAMIPRSGGFYVFAHRALGPYAGFVVGWSDWLSTSGTTAAVAIVIGEYTGILYPPLAARKVAVALAVSLGCALLQWRGIRTGSRAQNVTSLLKALAFLAVVLACFIFGRPHAAAGSPPALQPRPALQVLTALVLALQGVLYTYDGWYGTVYFGEEVRDPDRDIPRSMIGGVLLVILIYVLVNLSLIYLLPMSELAGQPLALGAAAQAVFGSSGVVVVASLALITLLSLITATNLTAPRILFAMSRGGLFSSHAQRVNRGGTPTVALFASTLATVLFILSGTFDAVLAVLAFFFVTNYAVSFLSVFLLRRREPEARRPYRAWGYPWTTGLVLFGSAAFLAGAIVADTRHSLYALLLLAASYPAFLMLRRMSPSYR